jgi:hypothetical protein
MHEDIPVRPTRISREDARTAKERGKVFAVALKAEAKAADWRCADGEIFRQHGDWFVNVMPYLLWGRGATTRLFAKPMAIDPLFWRIVGLPDNERLPLSFRANGAWVLRPPFVEAHISLAQTDPARLAADVVAWSTMQLTEIESFSVDTLLSDLERLGARRQNFAALEICLHLLRDDYERAFTVCRDSSPSDSGGFISGTQTFLDQARDWIVNARRAKIKAV